MSHPQKGFTLLELMVVIALISMLLGIGSALFTHRGEQLALKMAAYQTAAVLQSAQNASLQENMASTVLVFAKENTLEVWSHRLAGVWHLEDAKAQGAWGRNGRATDVTAVPGKIGKALFFEAGKSKLDCGKVSTFGLSDGFHLSFWVYPERMNLSKPQTLLAIDGLCFLTLEEDSRLLLKTSSTTTRTDAFRLPLYQWSWVEITQDQAQCSLHVDHVLRLQKANASKAFYLPGASSIQIGSFFQGKIDEVTLFSRVLSTRFSLPANVEIVESVPTIFFTREGHLDPSRHLGGVTLRLGKWEGNERIAITLSEIGQIQLLE